MDPKDAIYTKSGPHGLIESLLQPAVDVISTIATEITGENLKEEVWDDFEWHPWEIF